MNLENDLSSDSSTYCNDFQCDILDKVDDYNEFTLLTQINSFLSASTDALKIIQDIRIIKSGDLILGFSGFLKLSDMEEFFNGKIRNEIMKLAEENSVIFLNSRVSNTPLDFVLEMYKSHSFEKEKYIVVSPVNILKNEEYREKCRIYSEFNKEDIRFWPYNEEEVFLNKHKLVSTFIDGKIKMKIFKITNQNLKNFLNEFTFEISKS